MARSKAPARTDTPEEMPPAGPEDLVSTAPDDWKWETTMEESPTTVIFDSFGDVFIGMYLGEERIDPDNGKDEPFIRYVFKGRDLARYAVNKSYKLSQAMDKIDVGSWVKITYVKNIETSRGLQPMKDFQVDVRR